MIRTLSVLVAVTTLLAGALPAMSQSEGPVVEALPLGPDTSTFYLMPSKFSATETSCLQAIQDVHGTQASDNLPYLVNNLDDPCAEDVQPENSEFRVAISSTDKVLPVFLMPKVPKDAPMNEGESMTAKIYLFIESINPSVPVNVGGLQPRFAITTGPTDDRSVFAEWIAPDAFPDNLQGPAASAGRITIPFDVDFGPAPATFPGGSVQLLVDLTTTSGTDAPLYMVAMRAGIIADANNIGELVLPFAEGIAPPDDGDGDADNTTGNETDPDNGTANPGTPGGNQTDGDDNMTGGNQTDGHGNHTADNHTDGEDDVAEEGFLPGFELTALVAATGLALFAMHRRRPGGRMPGPSGAGAV